MSRGNVAHLFDVKIEFFTEFLLQFIHGCVLRDTSDLSANILLRTGFTTFTLKLITGRVGEIVTQVAVLLSDVHCRGKVHITSLHVLRL